MAQNNITNTIMTAMQAAGVTCHNLSVSQSKCGDGVTTVNILIDDENKTRLDREAGMIKLLENTSLATTPIQFCIHTKMEQELFDAVSLEYPNKLLIFGHMIVDDELKQLVMTIIDDSFDGKDIIRRNDIMKKLFVEKGWVKRFDLFMMQFIMFTKKEWLKQHLGRSKGIARLTEENPEMLDEEQGNPEMLDEEQKVLDVADVEGDTNLVECINACDSLTMGGLSLDGTHTLVNNQMMTVNNHHMDILEPPVKQKKFKITLRPPSMKRVGDINVSDEDDVELPKQIPKQRRQKATKTIHYTDDDDDDEAGSKYDTDDDDTVERQGFTKIR